MGAFDGTGQFNRSFSWQTDSNNAVAIQPGRMDTEDNGFATGLSNCLCKDGQSTPTSDIPLGGFNLKGVGTLSLNRVAVADADYSVAVRVTYVAYTTMTAPRAVTLQAAANYPSGTEIAIVDESGSCSATNAISATAAGSDTINGASTGVLSTAYAALRLVTDGSSKWTIVSQPTQLESGVDITGGTISGVAISGSTIDKLNGYGFAGFRNIAVNGDVFIDQANVGAAVSVNAGATIFHGPDMWEAVGTTSAGVFTIQQQTSSPAAGAATYLRAAVTTADASPSSGSPYAILYRVEGSDIRDLGFGAGGGKPITISFMVRSSLTGTFGASVRNGAPNRSYPFTFAIALANTWTPVSVTIPADTTGTWLTTTGIGPQLTIDLGTGSTFQGTAGAWAAGNYTTAGGSVQVIATNGATLDVTLLQIEAGAMATPFERRAYQVELALCQRYYQKSFPQGTAPAQNAGTGGSTSFPAIIAGAGIERGGNVTLPVLMRVAPTIVTFNPSATNSSGRDVTANVDVAVLAAAGFDREITFAFTGASTTAVGDSLAVHWTADARL